MCGYVYDPVKGDPGNGVEPGTEFRDLPDGRMCPIYFASESIFKKRLWLA